MHSVLYRHGKIVESDIALDKLADPKAGSGEALWIDVDQTDTHTFNALAKAFDLHPIIVTEALEPPGRARLDKFDDTFFLTVYGTKLGTDGKLQVQPLMAILTRNTMITIRPKDAFDLASVRVEWEANPDLLKAGAITMFWAVLDSIVDSHFDTAQDIDEQTSSLEADVFADNPDIRALQKRCYILHREVTYLRRISMPLRDISNSVLRHDTRGAVGEITPYLQDVFDHALRVADWTDNIHDTLTTLFDSILNAQSNQLAIVMKKISGWAALIAIPTMITGYFGMNVVYPGYTTAWGAWLAAGLMVGSAALLYWTFKRNNWL